ncbi:MAG: serine protease [Cyanobacteria bacterium P01_G01_bin.49]
MLKLLLTILSCSGLISTVTSPTLSQEIKTPLLAQQVPETRLYDQAQAISVKVISGNSWGSGVIVGKEGGNYTILTNRHVITPSDHHQVQTPDGRIHSATLQRNRNVGRDDLALLQFRSNHNYQVAVIVNSSSLRVGEAVYGVGFPFVQEDYANNQSGFVLTRGQVSLVLSQPLLEGYQLGYTNNIVKGMSGGAILNSQGQVIGINGKHAYPLWGDPFTYVDGSQPNPQLKKQMISISWGIPSEVFQEVLAQSSPTQSPLYSPNLSRDLEPVDTQKEFFNAPHHPPGYLW